VEELLHVFLDNEDAADDDDDDDDDDEALRLRLRFEITTW
jgi:hypothetical protein